MTRRGEVASFALVLAGGGARGYAHVGVLRALERRGLSPAGVVGVSMGAIVAATYSLREDWYEALLAADLGDIPHAVAPHARPESSRRFAEAELTPGGRYRTSDARASRFRSSWS